MYSINNYDINNSFSKKKVTQTGRLEFSNQKLNHMAYVKIGYQQLV